MNIIEPVLKEHTKAMSDRVSGYVGKNPTRFKELVEVFLKGPYRITQRAVWPMGDCIKNHPDLIKPHLKQIIKKLETQGIHHSVKRNVVRLLQFIDVPKSLQGTVATICFEFLSNPKEPIAIRVFSMTVLANLSHQYPAIIPELKLMIEDQLPHQTAGFKNRAKKILKALGSS